MVHVFEAGIPHGFRFLEFLFGPCSYMYIEEVTPVKYKVILKANHLIRLEFLRVNIFEAGIPQELTVEAGIPQGLTF